MSDEPTDDLRERAIEALGDVLSRPRRFYGNPRRSAEEILDLLAEVGLIVVDAPQLPERHCLRCKKDLTDVMGVYVFVGGKPVDGLLCVEHGANGANNLSADEYDRLANG